MKSAKVIDDRKANNSSFSVGDVYVKESQVDKRLLVAMVTRSDDKKYNLTMISEDFGNKWTSSLHKDEFAMMLSNEKWTRVDASIAIQIK